MNFTQSTLDLLWRQWSKTYCPRQCTSREEVTLHRNKSDLRFGQYVYNHLSMTHTNDELDKLDDAGVFYIEKPEEAYRIILKFIEES